MSVQLGLARGGGADLRDCGVGKWHIGLGGRKKGKKKKINGSQWELVGGGRLDLGGSRLLVGQWLSSCGSERGQQEQGGGSVQGWVEERKKRKKKWQCSWGQRVGVGWTWRTVGRRGSIWSLVGGRKKRKEKRKK